MFTNEQIKEYLDNCGSACPYCGSDNISADYMECEGMSAWRRVDCLNPKCLRKWTEGYKMVDIEELE
jgi:hypothetical protein